MAVSRYVASELYVGWSGRGRPAGGIAPVRSLRITFSHTSALAGTFAKSILSSIRPAVFSFSLWQVTQYRFNTVRCCDAGAASGVDDCSIPARTEMVPASEKLKTAGLMLDKMDLANVPA